MMTFDEQVELRLSALLVDRPADLCQLVLQIRREIGNVAGDCSEMLYHTHAVSNVFTYTQRLREAFIHIAVYSGHVNLGFNFGVNLPDPAGLLAGTGKLIRHIPIDSLSMVRSSDVKALVKTAVNLGFEMAENSHAGVLPRAFIDKAL